MTTRIVFYAQVHQPYRLRNVRFFDIGHGQNLFDDTANETIVRRVADKCYLPMNRVIADMIDRTDGRFRMTFSLSGTVLDQLARWAPDALQSFVDLHRTGCVEILGETWAHSLSGLFDPEEFRDQVETHARLVRETFGTAPRVFRNTELIFSDAIARQVAALGYQGILAEGTERWLGHRSARLLWDAGAAPGLRMLLRSYALSDDIAFRFSNRGWTEYPIDADRYASWIHRLPAQDRVVGLFMDYETFGEHQWADTGIFEFMRHLPERILANPRFRFATPSEVIADERPVGALFAPDPVSWADEERGTSAWLGNPMQRTANRALWALAPAARRARDRGRRDLFELWRRFTTSDHVYYMATKGHSDGEVHDYFNHHDSPYDAFVSFMNAIDDLRRRLLEVGDTIAPAPRT